MRNVISLNQNWKFIKTAENAICAAQQTGEAYSQVNNLDDEQIRMDFNALYQAMNGMTLRDMDKIIYPVCTLCRDHERAGFVAGVRVGVLLQSELSEK